MVFTCHGHTRESARERDDGRRVCVKDAGVPRFISEDAGAHMKAEEKLLKGFVSGGSNSAVLRASMRRKIWSCSVDTCSSAAQSEEDSFEWNLKEPLPKLKVICHFSYVLV